MWSSTTTTSSAWPNHCGAKMPIVAEPQPTRIRFSSTPSTTGGLSAATTTEAPPSICSSTGSRLPSAIIMSQATRPSFFEPPVRWCTPPSARNCEPYSIVLTWPTASPRWRTVACSGPR